MSKNMQRLGATLANRMKQTSSAAIKTTIELGTVNKNLSITPDGLRSSIPKGDYMVNLMLTGEKHTSSSYGGEYSHRHELPAEYRSLSPGDRILMSWCGNEPVVIAIVGTSSVLKFSDGDDTSGGGATGSGGSEGGDSGSSGTGSDGSGTPGQGGEDGFSPTILVTPIEGGNRVTITDINGPKTFDVMDGKTPEKGKDYFTAEEVEAIVQDVVTRVTALIDERFYTKNEIDSKIGGFVTGEEMSTILGEVFGTGE